MIRAVVMGAALALAGCASPVVTRIDAVRPAALPASASFAILDAPGEMAPVQRQAIDTVVQSLVGRGWSQSETGDFLLAVTVSERPAKAQLVAGDDFGRPAGVIVPAASRSNNKGCAKRDQRLTVTLANRATGDVLYAGAASEFHCKAAIDKNLPELVSAALTGMDGTPGVRQVERAGVR